MKTVAIMQPTYLPWIGYLALMDHVDEFVILDSVQFARRSWQQRNQIKTPNGSQWLTVPVISKGQRDQKICEVRIDRGCDFDRNHRRSITQNYAKARFFERYETELLAPFDSSNEMLEPLLMDFIVAIRACLGITTPLRFACEMSVAGAKADLLAAICTEVGASAYVSPPGSKDYLDHSEALAEAGVEVSYFHYVHPKYHQLHGTFLSHMSVLDLIFNEGTESLAILRGGVVI